MRGHHGVDVDAAHTLNCSTVPWRETRTSTGASANRSGFIQVRGAGPNYPARRKTHQRGSMGSQPTADAGAWLEQLAHKRGSPPQRAFPIAFLATHADGIIASMAHPSV